MRSNLLHASVDEFMQERHVDHASRKGSLGDLPQRNTKSISCQEIWLQGVEQGRILDWKIARRLASTLWLMISECFGNHGRFQGMITAWSWRVGQDVQEQLMD